MASFSMYVNRNSFMHRFNPSLKLISLVFMVVLIFLPLGYFGQLILLVLFVVLWIVAKLPARMMWSIIKSCLAMILILILINWIAYKDPGFVANIGGHAKILFNINYLWGSVTDKTIPNGNTYSFATGQLWGGTIGTPYINSIHDGANQYLRSRLLYTAADGTKMYAWLDYHTTWYSMSSSVLVLSGYITLKIFLMITIITIIVGTTNPVQLSFAIEDILNPLRYIRIPVNEWAMTISIALRFVPSLLDESQRILKAQASRGVDFNNGNFKDKIKSLVSLVVPMFSIAFLKADDLSNAMEARAYNPRYTRTRYRNYPITIKDWILFLLLAIVLGIFIIFNTQHVLFGPFGQFEAVLLCGSH